MANRRLAVAQDWRERKKAQTRQRLQEQALRLFTERGYEATTVEQVAAAAGVPHMTIFRYFRTKEDVVLSDSYDPLLVAAIRARPRTEDSVTRIRVALREGLGRHLPEIREALLVRTVLVGDDRFGGCDRSDGDPGFMSPFTPAPAVSCRRTCGRSGLE